MALEINFAHKASLSLFISTRQLWIEFFAVLYNTNDIFSKQICSDVN